MSVRRAAVAGSWYPGEPQALVDEVEEYLEAAAAPSVVSGRLIALISPHAGLRYSGPVAAHGYKLLRGRAELTFLLVGPSHRTAFHGVSLVASGFFETPLGRIAIDEGLAGRILDAHRLFADEPLPHRNEHSLEMQLPFLQHLVPRAKIVPMLMGSQQRDEVEALASALAAAAAGRDDVILVASSDLSHYHPAPVAQALDAKVVDHVSRLDAAGLMDRLEISHEHACGGGPIVAVMTAAQALGASRATVLRYATSGDVADGDKTRVVGYLSAALHAV